MNLLSIGGSDPSSGAGIQSDVKTFSILGAYGVTVVTAITNQSTSSFGKIEPVSEKMVKKQIESIISDFDIDGIKIGMVYNSKIINAIHKILRKYKIPIVLDPVIKSTTGGALIEKNALKNFKENLVSISTVITPNKFEAEQLTQIKIKSKNDLRKAAKKIQNLGINNVVITGITSGDKITDYVLEGNKEHLVSGNKIKNINHGSGCNYSAAMIFAMSSGKTLHDAVKFAKKFTYDSIKNSKKVGRGIKITHAKNDKIFNELTKSVKDFLKIKNIYKQIPECQTNFVYAKKNPKSIKNILGVNGRIVKTGKAITVAGNLEYGGSKHVASALLAMNHKFPNIRSAINIRYQKKTIIKLQKKFTVISYDRKDEPMKTKSKEGSSVPWGIKSAIKNSKIPPDAVYHTGDIGKEPMIIVFGKDPDTVIEKISKIQ